VKKASKSVYKVGEAELHEPRVDHDVETCEDSGANYDWPVVVWVQWVKWLASGVSPLVDRA
jgi:hypothetical protein